MKSIDALNERGFFSILFSFFILLKSRVSDKNTRTYNPAIEIKKRYAKGCKIYLIIKVNSPE